MHAFGFAANMLGAIITAHWSVTFFMNWFGAQHGEGYEYHLLALSLIARGAGAWSLDRVLLALAPDGAQPALGACVSRSDCSTKSG